MNVYRCHHPDIMLLDSVEDMLNKLKYQDVILGLITDGRSISQRNKIAALGLGRWFDEENIIISEEFGSEKTDERNFRYFMEHYPNCSFTYVGDNPKKDFVIANSLGWMTICLLDDGRNIHKQDFDLPIKFLPKDRINSINKLQYGFGE